MIKTSKLLSSNVYVSRSGDMMTDWTQTDAPQTAAPQTSSSQIIVIETLRNPCVNCRCEITAGRTSGSDHHSLDTLPPSCEEPPAPGPHFGNPGTSLYPLVWCPSVSLSSGWSAELLGAGSAAPTLLPSFFLETCFNRESMQCILLSHSSPLYCKGGIRD